jgi:hypothetical protein
MIRDRRPAVREIEINPRIEEIVMRSYLKELTVEEEVGGKIVSRKVEIAIYPVLRWSDGLGIYHQLILFGSDLDWLSKMQISLVDRYS